jgi:hypothetical protein
MVQHFFARLVSLMGGVLLLTPVARADEPAPVADKDVKSLVDQRIKEWQPMAEEKRFDEIGWCTSLLQAEELAKKHGRPIFLFTHDGKMQVGRC